MSCAQLKKRLPPFGKELSDFLGRGITPRNDVFTFCGMHAWDKARAFANRQFVLCLPFEDKPTKYIWPVQGCSIFLIDTGGLPLVDIESFAYFLLKSHAEIVRATLSEKTISSLLDGSMIVFRKIV